MLDKIVIIFGIIVGVLIVRKIEQRKNKVKKIF